MILTVVGSGTLLPDARHGSASLHVAVAGHRLLVDAGAGTLHGLPRAGVDWRAIDTVAISHFHPDHVVDLPALLAAFRFEERSEPLTVCGPNGLVDWMRRLSALHGDWILEPSRPLTLVELAAGSGWTSNDGALRLDVADTPHTPESLAYRITAHPDGAATPRLGYTGDTGPSDALGAFLLGCDVLVSECSLADPPEIDTHLAPSDLAALARVATPSVLVVTHVYPPRTPDDVAAELRGGVPCRVVAGADGLRIEMREGLVTVDPPRGLV